MPSSPSSTRGDAKRAAQRRSQLIYAAVAAVVVVFVVVIAVMSTGERGSAVSVDDLAGDPAISGDPLPIAPQDPSVDPTVGQPAPVVEGAGFDGSAVTVGAPGDARLVMFLASWCPACERELPEVVRWLDAGGLPDGVALTAVATGLDASRPNWPPDAWLEEEGFTGEVLVDDAQGSVARAYGLSATPFWVVLDADGEVVARIAGLLETEQLDALAELALTSG